MRVGSTVLFTEKKCVQSYAWSKFRSLGRLQCVIDSLEEYQCDEVAIVRPIRATDNLKNFKDDLSELRSLNTMTPISFGGGIRSIECLELLNGIPIERLIFCSAFLDNNVALLNRAKDLFGHQAIQCMMPFACKNGEVSFFHPAKSRYILSSEIDWDFIDELANEVILTDSLNEGKSNSFDWSILENIPVPEKKLIISGGVGNACIQKAYDKKLASVLIDNKVLHKEYSILGFKYAALP